MRKQTRLRRNVQEVFADYGGWGTLFSSGYFWLAVIISISLWPLYANGRWADFAMGIIPVVLGLTLAGAAILTTIGGDAFRERLAQVPGSTGQEAPILELLSNFILAMIVQLCALIYALIFQAKPFEAAWLRVVGLNDSVADLINFAAGGLGALLLVYGILLILGAAFTVRALASVYVLDARAEQSSREEDAGGGRAPPSSPVAPPRQNSRHGGDPSDQSGSSSRAEFIVNDGQRTH